MEDAEQPAVAVTREPLWAIALFWLTITLFIPAYGALFAVSLTDSLLHFAMAALAGTAIFVTIVGLMIRYVGFRKSPIRISILLALTVFFAIIHGLVLLNWIGRPETQASNTSIQRNSYSPYQVCAKR